jgi:hypothetical protein
VFLASVPGEAPLLAPFFVLLAHFTTSLFVFLGLAGRGGIDAGRYDLYRERGDVDCGLCDSSYNATAGQQGQSDN